MRWLDFKALRDLLILIGRHANGLPANELEQLANAEGVLLRRDGHAYARSIHYHHRRTLERLGLLQKQSRRFVLNHSCPGIDALTIETRYREQLHCSEKAAFADAVIRNKDCHDVFLGHFLTEREPVHDVASFIEQGHHVQIAVRPCTAPKATPNSKSDRYPDHGHSKCVSIRGVADADWSVAHGPEAVQAIHFGLRSWCADQLGFIDVAYRADGSYFAFPKHIDPQLSDRELATAIFADLSFTEDWVTMRVPDCTLSTGIKHRVSIEQTKDVLMQWLIEHPDLVAGVPSRIGFITAGLTERQQVLALKSYLQSNSGAYLSHIRVHHLLRQRIQEEDLDA